MLGKDPQPADMQHYVRTAQDNGGVHINSGIPNRAFYLVATALSGRMFVGALLAAPWSDGQHAAGGTTDRGRTQHHRTVAVGRFVAQKGFDTLLRAWRLVVDRMPDRPKPPELVLVGDGPELPGALRTARELGIAPIVNAVGAQEEVLPLLSVSEPVVPARPVAPSLAP